jgi:hypothetical protein
VTGGYTALAYYETISYNLCQGVYLLAEAQTAYHFLAALARQVGDPKKDTLGARVGCAAASRELREGPKTKEPEGCFHRLPLLKGHFSD